MVGAGIGGLAAAGALAPVADSIIVIDRDEFVVSRRRGVPQSDHLHNLLSRAQRELERCLPGFLEILTDTGCGNASVADETHVYELGRRMPRHALGFRLMCARRPTIESAARTALDRHGNVHLRWSSEAVGLRQNLYGRVDGVQVRTSGGTAIWPCDLVIDATGASGSSGTWVAQLGHKLVPVDASRQERWFVSTVLHRPATHQSDPSFWLTFGSPPSTRGGLLSPMSADHWWLSVSGSRHDPIPRTLAGVRNYAASLDDLLLYEQITHAVAQTTPRHFRRPTLLRRRFELMEDFPAGVLPVGDAIAVLDPLFGQGMSVAAWQATALLDAVLGWDGKDWSTLTNRYLARAAEICDAAMQVGVTVAATLAATAPSPDKLSIPSATLGELIACSPSLHQIYVSIWHLLTPAFDLRGALAAAATEMAEPQP